MKKIEEMVEDYMSLCGKDLVGNIWFSTHHTAQKISGLYGISYEQADKILLERIIEEIRG